MGESEVNALSEVLYGEQPLVQVPIYDTMRLHKGKGLISLVSAEEPWAFFVLQDENRAPQWVWMDAEGKMLIEPAEICQKFYSLLPGRENVRDMKDEEKVLLEKMLSTCENKQIEMLSIKHKRVINVFRKLIRAYAKTVEQAAARETIVSLWNDALFKGKSEDSLGLPHARRPIDRICFRAIFGDEKT